MLLENRVAIVSGVGPGMGRDIALRFAREGANLALGARSADYLESVAKEVRALGRRAVALPTDISKLEDCARLVGRAEEELGGVDILVNNAYHPGDYELFEHADLERWREPLEVNLFGSLRLTQEVVPRMKRRGGGAVVFINSMIVREVLPNVVAPVLVFTTLIIPNNILFEAALSFLGLGVPIDTPSWGQALSNAANNGLYKDAPWLMIFPGVVLVLTTLAFNLLGDGLRDALDPRSER